MNKNLSTFPPQLKKDNDTTAMQNYAGKSIQFYKNDRNQYILTFADTFNEPDKENPILSDIYKDLQLADKNCEIHVFIHSHGGSVNTLMALIAEIRKFKHVVTVCTSFAMSAGFILWLCGKERYVEPIANLMYHGIAHFGIIDSKIAETKEWIEHAKLGEELMQVYLGIDKILSKEEIEKAKYTEVWYTGTELIARHIARPYLDYSTRYTFGVIANDETGSMWRSLDDGTFVEYIVTNNKKTLEELNGFDEPIIDIRSVQEQSKPSNKKPAKKSTTKKKK